MTLLQNEMTLNEESIELLNRLVYERTGIVLGDSNKSIMHKKILSRIRDLGLGNFPAYYELLKISNASEINYLLNASTINFTSFMREKDSFHQLTDKILPEILQRNNDTKKIRIWSSACSTGEEAYTLAIVLKEALQATPFWDVKIVATDIDTDVLAVAKEGIYTRDKVSAFNPVRQKKWFMDMPGNSETVKIVPEIRQMVDFKHLNLNSEWAQREAMDLIFCRNVLIYFNKETRSELIKKFSKSLNSHGWLIIGRSESIFGYSDEFVSKGASIFQLK